MDAQQQLILALRREVRMLKTECAYLRQQVDGGRDVLGTPASVIRLRDSLGGGVSGGADHSSIAAVMQDLTQTRVMLQQYMQENEELRLENMRLCSQQQVFQRQHEVVIRENQQMQQELTVDVGGVKAAGAQGRRGRKAFDRSDSMLEVRPLPPSPVLCPLPLPFYALGHTASRLVTHHGMCVRVCVSLGHLRATSVPLWQNQTQIQRTNRKSLRHSG